jgi:hypothetical protein
LSLHFAPVVKSANSNVDVRFDRLFQTGVAGTVVADANYQTVFG